MVSKTRTTYRSLLQHSGANWSVVAWICIASILASLGCNRSNPYLTASPSGFSLAGIGSNPAVGGPIPPEYQQQFSAQLAEVERRAKLLDDNNRQLTTQLAQSQQQMQLYKERADLMQRQLAEVNSQLQNSRVANVQSNQQLRGLADRMQSMESSQQRRGSARLTANTSGVISATAMRDLGFAVEENDGVIRVRVPADQLFQTGTAQLSPSAGGILDRLAQVIANEYRRQRVSIEGHTDNGQLYGGTFTTNHQLAAAQSNAVMEYLTRRSQLPANQLFTLAHGDNYSLGDNQTPAGRFANRRIEFVIYPETW